MTLKRSAINTALATLLVVGVAGTAAADVRDGNESDIGVYTDGASDVMDIGDPTYTHLAEVEESLDPGVRWTAESMHQSIFEADLAAGNDDFYLDRVLGVTGSANNSVLQTRGRTLYMRGANNAGFQQLGFAGTAYAGGPNNLGDFYSIEVVDQEITEDASQRFNAPSHAKTTHAVGDTGVVAEQRKFITYDNVAVTALSFTNSQDAPVTLSLNATSPIAQAAGEADNELTGSRDLTSGSNNGLVDTPWSTIQVSLMADGFEREGSALVRDITVPAGESVDVSVVGVLYSDGLTDSLAEAREYAAKSPDAAFTDAVTAFNETWASDIPYIDMPDPALEKAIVYRWWGERYNIVDANEPGYVYQFPTTVEGSNLYQNSVVLTQPMHLQDTKWIRNPYLGYGQVLNVGELSGSSAFLDSPGHTSWNNHYSQYLATAGLEAFQVHGGGPEIAEKFATYFEGDGEGQLSHYDGNDDLMIAYDTNYMPGNDSDAITFGYPKENAGEPGARTIERPESAYVWGAFDAAKQLYELAGADAEKVQRMGSKADAIQEATLDAMWNEEMRMFLARTSHGAQAAPSANGQENPLSDPEFIPVKESNLYDIYAEEMIPHDDWETYVDGFRFLRYGDNFPIFPFYTANQYDRAKYGIGGSNNFSNINFTVQYRGVRAGLRHYDPNHQYVDGEYAARLLDWMAWSIYPDGDARVANQAEYYSGFDPDDMTFDRNNPNHVMLGNMNYIMIEDMGGIQPRSDDLIELWPVDFGYEHFMVNNLRYHGSDVTIIWDPDGTHYGLGEGYSLFLDGERVVSADELGRFVYDPNAHEIVESDDGLDVSVTGGASEGLASAVDTPIEDGRVVDYLKKVGIDLEHTGDNLAQGATVSAHHTQEGARPTPWREFHTPGFSSGAMNHTPGAIAEPEMAASTAAVVDGVTANEPFWGNHGTEDDRGWIELDLGSPTEIDNVKLFFVSDRQEGGYSEPQRYSVQIPDGSGGWETLPEVFKSPKIPDPKLNEALFETVTTDRLRIAFTNSPGRYTAISEIQVFDSGREVPEVVNDAPVVTVQEKADRQGNLSTELQATAVDDGLPEDGELEWGWELVSAPEGGNAIFSAPGALSTRVTGTVPGDYTLQFWASDGEHRTEREISVKLAEREASVEFGQNATITTSGSAGWEDPERVNDPSTPENSAPGAGQGWGNWGQEKNGTSEEKAAWIQYSWDSPVLVNSTDVYWYDDNGGTRRPAPDGYVVEYTTDGETWEPVTLRDGSDYAEAVEIDQYNHLDFEPVSATAIRIRISKLQGEGDGTGVLRWRVNGEGVTEVASPVIIRTQTGTVPELPAELDVAFESGARGKLPFEWQEITEEMVAETNVEPFTVNGTNSTYGLISEAQIYVRPELSEGGIAIQGAESFEQTVEVGQLPYLPERVHVSYNDGSQDNQAVGVEWDFDESIVETPGVKTVQGDLVLPWYVSDAGTVTTTLTLTVIEATDEAPTGLTVTSGPDKTEYVVGEELDLTGLEVTASYPDGTSKVVDNSALEVSGFDPEQEGEQTVTLTWTQGNTTVKTTFTVTVTEADAEPTPTPDPTITPEPSPTAEPTDPEPTPTTDPSDPPASGPTSDPSVRPRPGLPDTGVA